MKEGETMDIQNSARAQKAMALFKEGYNCSQAVLATFASDFGLLIFLFFAMLGNVFLVAKL